MFYKGSEKGPRRGGLQGIRVGGLGLYFPVYMQVLLVSMWGFLGVGLRGLELRFYTR